MNTVVDQDSIEGNLRLIHVEAFLRLQESAAAIWNAYLEPRAPGKAGQVMKTALLDGWSLLEYESRKSLRLAKDAGHLLFCFEGTTAMSRQEVAA